MRPQSTQVARQLSILHEFSGDVMDTLHPDELLSLIVRSAQRLVPCDMAALAVISDPAPCLLLREGRPLAEGVHEQAKPIVCAEFRKLTSLNIAPAAAQVTGDSSQSRRSGPGFVGDIQSICAVPLRMGREAFGVVSVLSLEENAFDDRTVELLETLANQAASAIVRLRARPMAHDWPLESVLDAVPEALLLLSPAGEVLACNSTAQPLLPLLTDDHQLPGVLAHVQTPRLQEALEELFTDDSDIVTELDVGNRSGPRRLALRLTRVLGSNGEGAGLVHLEDITQERILEERMLHSSKLASIGELAASVAHELNNPLTTILGFADLLLRAKLPSETIDDIAKIHAAALRSRKIAHDMLAYARGSAPGMTTFDLNDALSLPIRLVGKHFRADDIAIVEDFDPDLPPVQGDMGQLQQVLLNLLQNAHHAIATSRIGSRVVVSTRVEGEGVAVEVRDDGPGIPDDLRDRIFDPLFTTKPSGEGTGLGLSIARRIVESHGGTICVDTSSTGGTCFAIAIPLEQARTRESDDGGETLKETESRRATAHDEAMTMAATTDGADHAAS